MYRIKCNADNKTQSFQMWPMPFIKSFTSSQALLYKWIKNLKIYKLKSTS